MNSNVSKPFPTADTSNSRKKSKRKKRKNKYKHSINRKYQKKCYRPNSPGYSNYPKTRTQCFKKEGPSSWKIMSNWYWSNYKKAFEWQDKHKIAHWKACAFALQEENRCLMQLINSMQPGMCPSVPVTMQDLNENTGYHKQSNVKSHSVDKTENLECGGDEENCEDEYEFEMSEEMMEFFEKSFKHKMDLQKQKEENEAIEEEKEINKIQSNKLKRSEEMQLLYGDAASMIIGMETAVQLSFDKFCDTKSPKFWPNIPLRL